MLGLKDIASSSLIGLAGNGFQDSGFRSARFQDSGNWPRSQEYSVGHVSSIHAVLDANSSDGISRCRDRYHATSGFGVGTFRTARYELFDYGWAVDGRDRAVLVDTLNYGNYRYH